MSISSSYAPVTTACNGSTTEFTFTWDIDTTDQVVVTLIDSESAETTLTDTDYTVTATNQDFRSGPGGTVTTVETYAAGYSIKLSRSTSITQATAFLTSGAITPAAIRNALDKLTMIAQELDDRIGTLESA